MNKVSATVIAAIVAGAASFGAVAQPQPHGPGGPGARGPAPHMQPQPAPHAQPPRGPAPHAAPQQPPRGPQPGMGQRVGSGPDHKWVKGTRVPPQYRSKQYVVHDWQRHGLHRPGRGQQWVQYGGDYLLVAAATGVIVQLVFNH
jgi:Ni/Co efflux regulator RcnB